MISHRRKLILLLCLGVISATRKKCKHKTLPNTESPVCVCNDQYCDTLPPVEAVADSEYLIYLTSKSGIRLRKSVKSFCKTIKGNSVIEVDANKEYQTIIGWGGAMTDSAAINIRSLSEGMQEKLMRSYFSEEGLEYNILRVPIGSTDFSTRFYTLDDGKEDIKLANFLLAEEDTEYKIPLIKLAKTYSNSTLRLLAAAWAAPNWIQTKNNTAHGKVKPSMYQAWADYHLKFLQSYKQHGLNFWAISTGNEPLTTKILFSLPAVGWDPRKLCAWIVSYFGPTLKNSEFSNIKILTVDDSRWTLPWFVDKIFSCGNSEDYVDGLAVHFYSDAQIPPTVLDVIHWKYPDKFILQTEACMSKLRHGIQHGSWKLAEYYAEDIMENINHWSTGWLHWNLALNMAGGPNLYNNEVNALIFIDTHKGEFYKQPMYYILGHFSKFIPRGSVRISHESSNVNLITLAAKRPDGRIAVVVLNKGDIHIPVSIAAGKEKYIYLQLMPQSIATVLYTAKDTIDTLSRHRRP